jgi:hypothetical protein
MLDLFQNIWDIQERHLDLTLYHRSSNRGKTMPQCTVMTRASGYTVITVLETPI